MFHFIPPPVPVMLSNIDTYCPLLPPEAPNAPPNIPLFKLEPRPLLGLWYFKFGLKT